MELNQLTKEKQIWKSALVLTIAGLVTKILSAAYRIPFQNIAGDIGFYIYQQVYPFYGLTLILSTYGFPVIISKLLAEQMESKKSDSINLIISSYVFLSLFFIVIFLLFYTSAEQIALWMGDKELLVPLKVVSFSFLFIPFLSVLRGYFQGQNNMTPTAISQIGEQSVRVITILLFSYLLITNGYSSYISSAGAVFGSITGGFCGSVILLYFWTKHHKYKFKLSHLTISFASLNILKKLIVYGFTICISSLFLILLQLVDAMTLFSQLVSSGHFSEIGAKIEKGVFDRGQPLIQLGTVVATSLSLTLVPLISGAKARGDFLFISEKVLLSIRVSFIIGLGAALGLIAIIEPTNRMLFTNENGSFVLAILSITILFSSIMMTAASIIQGLGNVYAPALYVLFGVACKIALNYLLIPNYGTLGAAVSTVIAYLVATILHLNRLSKMLRIKFLTNYMGKAVWAGVVMLVCLYSYQFIFQGLFSSDTIASRGFASFQALTSVFLGGATYLIIILKTKIFSDEELQTLPLGERLLFLLKDKRIRSKEGGL